MKVTNTDTTPLLVFEYGNTEDAKKPNHWGPKGAKVCTLAPNESCHVDSNFGVERLIPDTSPPEYGGSGSLFTNNGEVATELTGTCPFGANVSAWDSRCGVVP
jgi:hypothetical protein